MKKRIRISEWVVVGKWGEVGAVGGSEDRDAHCDVVVPSVGSVVETVERGEAFGRDGTCCGMRVTS